MENRGFSSTMRRDNVAPEMPISRPGSIGLKSALDTIRPVIKVPSVRSIRWKSVEDAGAVGEDENIKHGVVRFTGLAEQSACRESKYLTTTGESVDRVVMAMASRWEVTSPHLVMSIISNDKYFKPWRQQDALNDFQEGLMKAASLTSMWILTNGRNVGVTDIVGQGVIKEKNKRQFMENEQNLVRFLTADVLPPIIVIGLVSTKEMATVMDLDPDDDGVIEDPDSNLSPAVTHFIILDDEHKTTADSAFQNFAGLIETRLIDAVGKPRRYMQRTGSAAGFNVEVTSTPLVGLLTNSGPNEVERVLRLVKMGIPVIVLHGDGSAADLLAFAVSAVTDSLYSEIYVKSELLRRINLMFHDEFRDDIVGRNSFRDKILQCVTLGIHAECRLITLINRNHATPSLRDMNKIILKAFLEGQKRAKDGTSMDHVYRNLQLTIDWMNPELAKEEIFKKFTLGNFIVGEELFEQALLRPDREEFVVLFLDHGFILHKYLTQERLGMLFEQCQDKNFFIGICLEGILGVRVSDSYYIHKLFVGERSSQLNHLIYILTGIKNLIDPYQLTLNASTSVRGDKRKAEQLALHALVFWATLTNRTTLAKRLWSRSTQPMALGLVLSTLYRRLSKYWVSDFDLQIVLDTNGVSFGQLAIQLLDFTFRESASQAVFALTIKLADFQRHTPIEIAVMGKNKHFISHPCCQRYLYHLWNGEMRIRRSRRWGQTLLSDNVKIILCLLFVVPVFRWVDLPEKEDNELNDELITADEGRPEGFYFMFLALYAYSLLLPMCGDVLVNLLLIFYLIAYIMDHIQAFITDRWEKHRDVYMDDKLWNVGAYLCSATLIFLFRVMNLYSPIFSITTVKIMLCFLFVYFAYKGMKDILPVSQSLGPLLVSITVMIRRDLLTWTRIWFLVMVSGSITVFAVLYPAHPFGIVLVHKAFMRGIFTLFSLQIEYSRECEKDYLNYTYNGCGVQGYVDPETFLTCPYFSLSGYFIALQYIFITKLVFSTLIFAICSVTLAHTYAKAVEIWKYQFCLKVLHHIRRPVLPVPLTVLTYPCTCLTCCYALIRHYCMPFCPCCGTMVKEDNEDFHTWRVFVQMQTKEEQLMKEERELPSKIEERLMSLVGDMKTERKQMDGLKDRLVGALNSQTAVLLLLEKMKHKLEIAGAIKKESGKSWSDRLHTNCRNSLYPGTALHRSVVFDKDVPWEEACLSYDPVLYSKPVQSYPLDIRSFVDPDVIELAQINEDFDRDNLRDSDLNHFLPIYNSVVTRMTHDGDVVRIDRTTFCETDKASKEGIYEYALDDIGVPSNPMGRTGLRGRGNLWRWGPNHVIYAIITRWCEVDINKSTPDQTKTKRGSTVGVLKELQFMVVPDPVLHDNVLPGGFVTGRTTKYSVMCECFMKDVLNHDDVTGSDRFDEDDMTQFFRQFVVSEYNLLGLLGRADSTAFQSNLIYQGYMDDRNNTDNAWIEAEIWHFHYEKNSFDRTIQEPDRYWQKLSNQIQLTKCQVAHVLDAAAKVSVL